MSALLVNLAYIAAAVMFIYGLRMLGSPATARSGNSLSAGGMLIAIVATLLSKGIVEFHWIAIAAAAGALVGALASRLVAMTSMPEMVALFNGSGGIASLLVGWAALFGADAGAAAVTTFTAVTIFLSVMIGGVTFSGSLIAWSKLAELMPSGAIVFAAQRVINGAILLGLVVCGVMLALLSPHPTPISSTRSWRWHCCSESWPSSPSAAPTCRW